MKGLLSFLSLILCMAWLSGCSSASSSAQLALNMVSNSTSSSIMVDKMMRKVTASLSPWAVGDYGSNTEAELQSLKYVFGGIWICEDVTINGSAFSNMENCVTIYEGPVVGDGSSEAITPSTLADYSSSQIDVMSATSLATINQAASLTSGDAHEYNYAVINWYTPIAVKGCVTTDNGLGLVCTKGTGATYSGTTTTTTADLSSSSTSEASEAIVVSANGGSFFKFQNPFVISSEDISNGTSFTVDMVFNPTGVLSGRVDSNADGNLRGAVGSMYVPMLNLAPVPRKGAQTTQKETYLTTGNCPDAKYRIELYYNSDDDTTLLGATGTYVYDENTSSASIMQTDMGSKVIAIEVADDDSLTLKIPSIADSVDWISALARGENGTLTMHTDTPQTCAYEFVGTTTVN